ncbi:hypothetical protein [Streptomyces sp. NBC_01373]|uniref:hypothetical protein n=1 Tax=Streptomyces sp. NBC_01373 TaxID=2903843 RepID=UPI002254DD02|nr:hypothetical protein [Streptomyces sp. NBC_01373]MCX4705674.1 hypothetical protein [Streptomyces sp. NBC_01373]
MSLFEFDPDDLDEDTLERFAEMTDEDLAEYLEDPEAEVEADDDLDDAPAEPAAEDVYNEPEDPLGGIPKNPARGVRPINPYRGVVTLPPL